jgi:hypothetical protein
MSDPIASANAPANADPSAEPKSPLDIDVDWHGYFDGFCSAHGGNPILHGGRLLFSDGWTYSRTSYRGPEWPPPKDPVEKVRLILLYWRKRRIIVESQRIALADMVDGLKALQAAKSAPIMHRLTVRDDQTGKATTKLITFNPEDYVGRLMWLEADVKDCDLRIAELAEDLRTVPEHPRNDLVQG